MPNPATAFLMSELCPVPDFSGNHILQKCPGKKNMAFGELVAREREGY